tara:strand:+ start:628 stop:2862 length:2235 start_codon:yes stop_codon:yes gene_type:complete
MIKELPKGKLIPAAQPVSNFLSYRAEQPSVPTKPQMLPGVKGINIIQRSNEMSVKGYNSFTEWSNAIKEVAGATQTALPVIKSEYEKRGREDVLRAMTLANRQAVSNGDEYAKENRRVSKEDWIAGINMDQVNPWRRKGQEEQLSILAGGEAKTYINRAYFAASGDLVGLDPGDPALDQVRGNAIAQLTKDFGIDETSAGFADHAIPKINTAWNSILEKQFKAHTKYQKAKQQSLTQKELYQSMIDWDQSQMSADAFLGMLGGKLNYQANKLGLIGEPTEFKKDVLVGLMGQLETAILKGDAFSDKAQTLRGMLDGIPIEMKKNKKGEVTEVITAGEMYGADFLLETDKIAQAAKRTRDRLSEGEETGFTTKYAEALIRLEKGSKEYRELWDKALNDESFKNLSFTKRLDVLTDLAPKDEEFARSQFDKVAVDAVFTKYRSLHGILYNENAAAKELRQALNSAPPELSGYVADQWNNFQTMSNNKRVTGKANMPDIRRKAKDLASNAVKSKYPTIGEKMLRDEAGDIDIGKYLGEQGEAIRTADIELRRVLEEVAIDALKEAVEEEKDISGDNQTKIIDNAMREIIKDKETMKGLLPDIGVEKEEDKKEGDKKEVLPTFKLDRIVPTSRLKEGAYKQSPVYDAETTGQLIDDLRKARRLPVPVINAAFRAGVSPQQLILDTAEFYKDQDFYPSDMERIRLLKQGKDEEGFRKSLQSRSPLGSPFSVATNHLAIVLTGIAPPRLS